MNQPEFEYLGPYKVDRIIGRGGMGTVYKGIHAQSGEPSAIKVIATGVANSPRFRRRFHGEIDTLQRLKHPNIVQLMGHGEEQGLLFYTMEYVDGHSLHDHLRQHRKMPFDEVIQVGIETSSALKHAHDFGVIHRDLKPANLMLSKDGHVKLTDFGIAKLFGSTDMTAAGSVIGTADYMPPEQAEGKGVTIRSDLYSLGGVLYALLCGKAPFGGKSVPEVLYSVRYNPVPRLDERVEGLPEDLVSLLHELLEKDPQKRPPTALVVCNRLKALQHGIDHAPPAIGTPDSSTDRKEVNETKLNIGPHLTSLDLSDVGDEEVQLSGEDIAHFGLAGSGDDAPAGGESNKELDIEASEETQRGDLSLPTHEQQTMVAPDDQDLQPISHASQGSVKASPKSIRESELSGEFEQMEDDEEPLTSGGPSHYTPIDEDRSKPYTELQQEESPKTGFDWLHLLSIAAIVGSLLGAVLLGWWMLQPQSADELYDRIALAAESGDDGEILAARADMNDFIERFGDDDRLAEVRGLADEAELSRWVRIVSRRAARSGGAQLTAIEQAFLDCMKTRSTDFSSAQEKMEAFLTVFGVVENLPRDEQRLVELVDFALKQKSDVDSGQVPPAAKQLEKLIQSAEKSLSGQPLETYYKELKLLFGDKPWADEQIGRLNQRLSEEN